MSPPASLPDSSTPRGSSFDGAQPGAAPDEEDFALGWECANPALQIECWRAEAAVQVLQPSY